MKVRTQDGLTIIPCEAIGGQRNDRYQAWEIHCISKYTGKPIRILGTYSEEHQFIGVFSELQGWLDDRSRKFRTYFMPPDIQTINESGITFSDVTLGLK